MDDTHKANSGPPHEWPFELFDPSDFTVPKRDVEQVILHNTGWDSVSYAGIMLVEEINKWHVAEGWHGITFHFVIDKHGNIVKGRSIETSPVVYKGKANGMSIAIAVQGLWHFTEIQMASVRTLCTCINDVYELVRTPVSFHGVCEVVDVPSPMFDYRALLGLDDNGMMNKFPRLAADVVAKEATRFQPLGASA